MSGELDVNVEQIGDMGEVLGVVKQGGCRYNNPQPTKQHKYCKKCNMTKGQDEFYHIKSSSDGLASNCKDCAVKIANMTRKHYHEEPTVDRKVCKLCGNVKPAEEFYRNRTNADGLFGKCKKCSDSQAEANRKPRVRHNVSEPTVTEKECTKCGIVKVQTEFNRDKTKADGLQFRCKACVHEYMRKRRRTDACRRQDSASAADHALAANNLAVLAQAAEPRVLPSGLMPPLDADVSTDVAQLPVVSMQQVQGQNVHHMDHLQAILESHLVPSTPGLTLDATPTLPLLQQLQQPVDSSALPHHQPDDHQIQDQILQHSILHAELPHQSSSALQGESAAASYSQPMHQQQQQEEGEGGEGEEHIDNKFALGHGDTQMSSHMSLAPEDDPMGSITLENPPS